MSSEQPTRNHNKTWSYRRFGRGGWMDNGSSMVSPEEFVISERRTAQQYKRDYNRPMFFVAVPVDKYPQRLTIEELEAKLEEQPEAINGILQ